MRNRSQFGAARSPPPAHTRGSLKSRFDPLSIALPVGPQCGWGWPGGPRLHAHPPRPQPANWAPFPLATGASGEDAGRPRLRPPPSHHTQPPNPPARGPSWDETARRKTNRWQIVSGNSCLLRQQPPPLAAPLPALRAIRHCTSTVQLRYDGGGGGGTKRILFSKVSLRFGGGTREKRKQGLPAPGIRVLTGWRGDSSARSAIQTPNSGTLTTAAR